MIEEASYIKDFDLQSHSPRIKCYFFLICGITCASINLQEIIEMREAVANSYLDQLKELRNMLDIKQKELIEVNRMSAEQRHSIEDLNERLSASMQSCNEANEILKR